jgi:hypothetical protein
MRVLQANVRVSARFMGPTLSTPSFLVYVSAWYVVDHDIPWHWKYRIQSSNSKKGRWATYARILAPSAASMASNMDTALTQPVTRPADRLVGNEDEVSVDTDGTEASCDSLVSVQQSCLQYVLYGHDINACTSFSKITRLEARAVPCHVRSQRQICVDANFAPTSPYSLPGYGAELHERASGSCPRRAYLVRRLRQLP